MYLRYREASIDISYSTNAKVPLSESKYQKGQEKLSRKAGGFNGFQTTSEKFVAEGNPPYTVYTKEWRAGAESKNPTPFKLLF